MLFYLNRLNQQGDQSSPAQKSQSERQVEHQKNRIIRRTWLWLSVQKQIGEPGERNGTSGGKQEVVHVVLLVSSLCWPDMSTFDSSNLRVVVGLDAIGEGKDATANVKLLRGSQLRSLAESSALQMPVNQGHELRIWRHGVFLVRPDKRLSHGTTSLKLVHCIGRCL